ncbi:MAG: DNA cytosine methyltransferase [Pelagibacterales bacterium]|nr:DNA cytosine methyltransferase [Pelagibacterales bacterium]
MSNKKINFIDLFCGAGGLSKGLIKSGLNCLVGIDHLMPAIETFKNNHPKSIAICDDLRTISTKEVKKKIGNKKVHLICGGPPCQGFSTIGPGNKDDSRNHLFLTYVKFVKDFKPNVILIENVTGLLAKKNIDTLESIFLVFEKLGYSLDIKVLSAEEYGVPQIRRRVCIIGNNLKTENLFPVPKYGSNNGTKKLKEPRNVRWAFENLLKHNNKAYNHDKKAAYIKKNIEKERIGHVPEGRYIRYERDEKEFLPKELWFDHDWNTIGEKRFREARYYRLNRKKPSPTIVTGSRMYYHPTEDRYLTVREAAAIQSFPANFKFSGSVGKQWTQIGNAVPPLLGFELGKSILKMFKGKKIKVKKRTHDEIEKIRSTAFKYVFKRKNKTSNQLSFNL